MSKKNFKDQREKAVTRSCHAHANSIQKFNEKSTFWMSLRRGLNFWVACEKEKL